MVHRNNLDGTSLTAHYEAYV